MTIEERADSLSSFDITEIDEVPSYLRDVYGWAYLHPVGRAVFDRNLMVQLILWTNYRKLLRGVLAEIKPGTRVLQLACVYGDFSPRLAEAIGRDGRLEVIDVAGVQVESCRVKLRNHPWATVTRRDASIPPAGPYDVVVCFFLLHEVPEEQKRLVVTNALRRLAPGGKAVFVDYHRPGRWHVLKPLMGLVFDLLEPFARPLWSREIHDYCADSMVGTVTWRKRTLFGGLYQTMVAERR